MRILTVGGGSGGHVTPVLAVIAALKAERPRADVRFWCDRTFLPQASDLFAGSGLNVPVRAVASGKFRRYHGIPLWRQLLDVPTLFANVRDGFKIAAGFAESVAGLLLWRPDVVFTKGGFVCLPVGVAAHLLRIPLVIHDSDAHPGLTNRVLSRFASAILTGAPVEYYPYERAKTTHVGIPIGSDFRPLDRDERAAVKRSLGLSGERPLVLVTGGGLGARRLNDAVVTASHEILAVADILHVTGKAHYEQVLARTDGLRGYVVKGFVSKGMAAMAAAADLVVARAGATTLLELAALGRPTILVPNAQLTGDHQSKNAAVYGDAGAAIVLSETTIADNPGLLGATVIKTLDDGERRARLSRAIRGLARPDAARDVARAIITAAGKTVGGME